MNLFAKFQDASLWNPPDMSLHDTPDELHEWGKPGSKVFFHIFLFIFFMFSSTMQW